MHLDMLPPRDNKLLEFLEYSNLRYELATNLYMAEPWEKYLVNVIFLLLLALIGYSTATLLPPIAGSLFSVASALVPVGYGTDEVVPLAANA